jgi:ureidoglycolate hydrolase
MDEKLLEIREFSGPGYRPLIDFGEWRVAVLNYLEEIHPERIDFMERHINTDEVFVMIKGQGTLLIGEGDDRKIERIIPQKIEPGKIYNVKRGVWHSVLLSQDGSVLIVENRDTCRENSSYYNLSKEQRDIIIRIGLQQLTG